MGTRTGRASESPLFWSFHVVKNTNACPMSANSLTCRTFSVANQHGLAIKVKPHPMESDFSIYRRAVGAEGPTGRRVLTDQLISSFASETLFATCYRSYTSLALTVLRFPTIERLNLVGLPGYKNDASMRDTTGAPILDIRRYEHVNGAPTSEEFFESVEPIIRDYDACLGVFEKPILLIVICPSQLPRKLQLKCYGSISRKKSEMETSK